MNARWRWMLAIALGTAVAWLQLAGVHWAARLWAAVLLVPLPALMIVQANMLRAAGPLPRREAYVSSIISLWLLAAATVGIAALSGLSRAATGMITMPPGPALITAAGLTVAGIALMFAFRLAGFRETATLRDLLPASMSERLIFVGVSITAGVTEEFIFRGFLVAVLAEASGSMLVAVVLSSGAFGVIHAYQRPLGALRAAILGALLALPVLLHGSILPAIIAHAMIDILSGLWLARYLLR